MANLLRKITIKAVAGAIDVEKIIKSTNKTMHLCDIIGQATKARPEESALGAYLKFVGRFRAINNDGEVFDAPTLIVPNILQDQIEAALSSPDSEVVEFAFRVSAQYNADSITKYVYQVEPLIPPSGDDPIEKLMKMLPAPPSADVGGKKGGK